MKELLIISLMTMAGLSVASARAVQSGESGGSLLVSLPPIPQDQTLLDLKRLSITFKGGGTERQISPGQEIEVAAGMGCVIVYAYNKKAEGCGIEIVPGKLTTVALAALEVQWNPDKFKVDFGFEPGFSLGTNDQNRSLKWTIGDLSTSEAGLYVLPAMNVELSIIDSERRVLFRQHQYVQEGLYQKMVVAPPELRGFIEIEYVEPAAKLKELASNYIVANFRLDAEANPIKDSMLVRKDLFAVQPGSSSTTIYITKSIVNFYRFPHENGVHRAKAFPLRDISPGANGLRYEVVVNQHPISLGLTPGKTFRLKVAAIDIQNYRPNFAGEYEVFSDRDQKMRRVTFPNPQNPSSLVKRLPTGQSLFLPFGYNYRFDLYARDTQGQDALQDQIELDLKGN